MAGPQIFRSAREAGRAIASGSLGRAPTVRSAAPSPPREGHLDAALATDLGTDGSERSGEGTFARLEAMRALPAPELRRPARTRLARSAHTIALPLV